MNKSDYILQQLLNTGEHMLISGAEVNRVEDTLNRMGHAYGASNMNVFVITSTIIITMTLPDGSNLTQSRRILSPGNTDFIKLEQLNSLSRKYCKHPLSESDFQQELEHIVNRTPDRLQYYLGSMLAAGSFAVFFGGTILDGIAGALAAVLICFLQNTLAHSFQNKIIFNLLVSFLVGTAISLMTTFLPSLHASDIMIGTIMLLIPGISMTNSIRDILMGDTISGIMRLIETLFWAGSLACGFMLSIWMVY